MSDFKYIDAAGLGTYTDSIRTVLINNRIVGMRDSFPQVGAKGLNIVEGDHFYKSDEKKIYVYNGTAWVEDKFEPYSKVYYFDTTGKTNYTYDSLSYNGQLFVWGGSDTGLVKTSYELPIATSTVLGGVKSSTTGTTQGRDYNVQINDDGTMKVNVPWSNSTYTLAELMGNSPIGGTTSYVYWNGSSWSTKSLGTAAFKSVTDNISNADVTSSDTNLITGRTLYYQLAKKGYLTGITSEMIINALGYTPMDSTNTSFNNLKVGSATNYVEFKWQNNGGLLPYFHVVNPNISGGADFVFPTTGGTFATQEWVEGKNYTSNTGTVTSVKVQGSNGLTGSGTVTTTGTITISHATKTQNNVTGTGVTLGSQGKFSIPVVAVDTYGHVTGTTTTEYTLPKLAVLDTDGKIPVSSLPDAILGQLVYGGSVTLSGANATTTLTNNAKSIILSKISATTTSTTISLNNSASDTISQSNLTAVGYETAEGVYFIADGNGTFASLDLKTGDWLISNGISWQKIDNTDAVTSVAGKTGAVTLSKADVGLSNVTNESKVTMFTNAALTGTPTAPTAVAGTNTTQIATTAFVKAAVDAKTSVSGNAGTATKLATARTISSTGDVTWSVSFDGSANASAAATLKNSGVTSGTYRSVTVNAKGIVTGGTNPTTLAGYGITDAKISTAGVVTLGSNTLTPMTEDEINALFY